MRPRRVRGLMRVMVFFSLHPVGRGEHVGDAVAEALRIVRASGLEHELGPSGTTLLGEWDEVFACIRRCHEAVGAGGARVSSLVKVDWWGFEPGAIRAKVERVEQRLRGPPSTGSTRKQGARRGRL